MERYRCISDEKLANICIPNDICCHNINCDNTLHILQVKQFYNEIVTCLIKSGEEVTPGSTKKQNVNKPGWSVHVAELYKASKDAYKTWASNGKPRTGPIYEITGVAEHSVNMPYGTLNPMRTDYEENH